MTDYRVSKVKKAYAAQNKVHNKLNDLKKLLKKPLDVTDEELKEMRDRSREILEEEAEDIESAKEVAKSLEEEWIKRTNASKSK